MVIQNKMLAPNTSEYQAGKMVIQNEMLRARKRQLQMSMKTQMSKLQKLNKEMRAWFKLYKVFERQREEEKENWQEMKYKSSLLRELTYALLLLQKYE